MSIVDISVIVSAHHEGRLAHRTMRALHKAIDHATSNGIIVEVIVVLDRPDVQTVNYFSGISNYNTRTVTVDYGDLGLARNCGIRSSAGAYIALLDSDDLFCENWLSDSYKYILSCGTDVVLHPEYSIIFEGKNHVWKHVSSTSEEFDVLRMLTSNYWTSLSFCRKAVFERFLYQTTTQTAGFGFEDWHFNCETLAGGVEHHVVPETVMYIRAKRSGSLLSHTVNESRIMRRTRLFDEFHVYDVAREQCSSKEEEISKQSNSISNKLKHVIGKYTDPVFMKFPKLYPFLARHLKLVAEESSANDDYPGWLIEDWKRMNDIEPLLYPDNYTLSQTLRYTIGDSRISKHFVQLSAIAGKGVSHIISVPWLKRAGADLVALNYIKYLSESGRADNIVVIATLSGDSPWVSRLPSNVKFIEFGNICSDLGDADKVLLLSKLLIQLDGAVIHNINSELMYKVFVDYGKALSAIYNLFTSVFCFDYSREGRKTGWHVMYLPYCYDYVDGIFSDNNRVLYELDEIYAFGKNRSVVHYQPVVSANKVVDKSHIGNKLDVVWAGRIDDQKRPDILIDIAVNTADMPITYHVYGQSLLSSDSYTEQLKALSNVKLYGAFDGISSLPLSDYDILLFTSQYEGAPTTIIETMLSGVPVMASSVGGIPELIKHEETGILIEPYDDVSLYVKALQRMLDGRYDLAAFAENGFKAISAQHSWASFCKELEKVKGYLP